MLEVQGVSKRYGSIRALSDVTMRIARGEIVAVVGENGAGKTTLVQCVARSLAPDAGVVLVDGDPLGRHPRDAIAAGVSVVWQDLALCENLDVTSNLFLGREIARGRTLRTASMAAKAASIFRELKVDVPDLDRPIHRLPGGQRQLVAIARATLDQPRVLILDEPTAALGVAETATVLGVIETLRESGVAIMLISHQLDEVFEVANRIVVLRHGATVADVHRAEAHPDDVVGFITGADVDSSAGRQLRRLHSLAEQLSDADEGSILPLTVSSLSGALNADRLAIFMVDRGAAEDDRLRSAASVNLPVGLTDGLGSIEVSDDGVFLAQAAVGRSLVIVPDLRRRPGDSVAQTAVRHGVVGAWAAPIVGQHDVMAVVAGFTDTLAQLHADQIQLLELFSTMAGATIDAGVWWSRCGLATGRWSGCEGCSKRSPAPICCREACQRHSKRCVEASNATPPVCTFAPRMGGRPGPFPVSMVPTSTTSTVPTCATSSPAGHSTPMFASPSSDGPAGPLRWRACGGAGPCRAMRPAWSTVPGTRSGWPWSVNSPPRLNDRRPRSIGLDDKNDY